MARDAGCSPTRCRTSTRYVYGSTSCSRQVASRLWCRRSCPTTLRAPSGGGQAPARQDAGQLRVRPRAHGLQGQCQRARRRRPLARPGRQRDPDRRSGRGRKPSGGRELTLESAIRKLDKYHLLISTTSRTCERTKAETSALFELVSSRYERRSTRPAATVLQAAAARRVPELRGGFVEVEGRLTAGEPASTLRPGECQRGITGRAIRAAVAATEPAGLGT